MNIMEPGPRISKLTLRILRCEGVLVFDYLVSMGARKGVFHPKCNKRGSGLVWFDNEERAHEAFWGAIHRFDCVTALWR